MSNIELGRAPTLAEEAKKTQKVRKKYPLLKIANSIEKGFKISTDTKIKKWSGFSATVLLIAASIVLDGNFAIATAEAMAIAGGAAVGKKIPVVSGPTEFFREKKAVQAVRNEKEVPVKDIAYLLLEFPDIVKKEKVKLWTQQKLRGEDLEHPERYKIMQAILNNNPESSEEVVKKFMFAQKVAQRMRRQKDYMRQEAIKELGDVLVGIAVMTGATNYVSFGLGYQAQAGLVGLADDIVLVGALAYCHTKDKIKSFFSKF